MTIAFVTLGCKLNYAETATWERAFIKAGLEVVPWQGGADIFVVNTCSVTATADRKSRSEIRKLHRINPDALIAVSGCSAQLRRPEIAAIEGVALVFGTEEKAALVPSVLKAAGLETGEPGGAGKEAGDKGFFAAYSSGEDRTRAFLKVQDGCNNRCAYCTVPMARGTSRNAPVCEIVRQAEAIAAAGVREVVLTGVNTGDFGRSTGESFLDLLKALDAVEGIERYRISSIEPNLITDEIVDWAASGTKIAPHFHIPLQVGDDGLLRRMGRRYTTEDFAGRLECIRRRFEGPGRPGVFFGIDVMTGLPGETDEVFERSKAFIGGVRPSFIHVFPYSRRPGTAAARMPDQVPEQVKAMRVKSLEELSRRLHEEFLQANKGLPEKALFESAVRDGMMSGYTGNYIRVSRPYDPSLVGRLTDVII